MKLTYAQTYSSCYKVSYLFKNIDKKTTKR